MFEIGFFLLSVLILFLDYRYGRGVKKAQDKTSSKPHWIDDDDCRVASTFSDVEYSHMEGNLFHIDSSTQD